MKKPLNPAIVAVIGIVTLVVLIGGGISWMNNNSGGGAEDPALAQKQLEYEMSKRPKADGGAVAPPSGASPGREGEMAARGANGTPK